MKCVAKSVLVVDRVKTQFVVIRKSRFRISRIKWFIKSIRFVSCYFSCRTYFRFVRNILVPKPLGMWTYFYGGKLVFRISETSSYNLEDGDLFTTTFNSDISRSELMTMESRSRAFVFGGVFGGVLVCGHICSVAVRRTSTMVVTMCSRAGRRTLGARSKASTLGTRIGTLSSVTKHICATSLSSLHTSGYLLLRQPYTFARPSEWHYTSVRLLPWQR